MEHEDNTHYLQNSQNLMENLQFNASAGVGCGTGEGVGGGFVDVGGMVAADEIVGGIGIGSNIGGKFEEHEEHDDGGEWKYIKEVQQSEKQQQKSGDVAAEEGVGNGDDGGQHHYENEVGNGNVSAAVAAAAAAAFFHGDEEEVEVIKNDGDFSTTSNTTSTAGEEDVEADVLQVEMKIEAPQQQLDQLENMAPQLFGTSASGKEDETEEEEPSSLATNTTNGTSSLSENLPQQMLLQQHDEHFQQGGEYGLAYDDGVIADKENADPLTAHPADFDFEMHSQLNPDAKEFVPHFGSNPTSPTSPVAATPFGGVAVAEHVGEPADSLLFGQQQQQPHPNAVPRHLLGDDDDDFVAQSPRKGRGFNMDSVTLPAEKEFEHEAALRPHELEQEDDLIGDGALQPEQQQQPPQQQQQFLHEELENGSTNNAAADDCLDFQRQSPASFIDHGPETSVDQLLADSDLAPAAAASDVMKQSIYVEHEDEEPIEDLLNTVQPIPNDSESINNSFIEEPEMQREAAGDKELLNVEEKEHVSHSPSIEEMQMNLQNDMHASVKDIPQIPIDMDNAEHMQGSFYMEHTSGDTQPQHVPIADDISLLMNTTDPLDSSTAVNPFDTSAFETLPVESEAPVTMVAAVPSYELEMSADFLQAPEDATPSPFSTEEKHLVEETKEQSSMSTTYDKLDDMMDNLNLHSDGNLQQVEEVAQVATTINDYENPFFTQDEPMHEEPAHQQQHQPELFQNEQILPVEEYQQHQQHYNELLQQSEPHQLEETAQQPEAHAAQSNATDIITILDTPPAQINEPEIIVIQDTPPAQLNEHELPTFHGKPHALFDDEPEVITEAVALPEVVFEPMAVEEPLPVAAHLDVEAPVTAETPVPIIEDAVSEPVVEAVPVVETVAVAAAAVVAATAVAAVAATSAKKPEPIKKPTGTTVGAGRTSIAAKPKVGDVKKPADTKKPATAARTTTTTSSAARPRTAPATKTATSTEKRTTTTTSSAAAPRPAPTAARRPLTATSATTARSAAPKTSSTTSAARPATVGATRTGLAPKTAAAPRTTTTSTAASSARKPIAASTAHTTNGTARPRPATAGATSSTAPTKPTTLGLSAAAKPKLTSPRSTLSSQLRKTAPAKSPLKPMPTTTNGVATKSSTTSTFASRTKATGSSTTTTTTTTTTTKTFTARPAPKTITGTTSSTTTTARRLTVGGVGGATTAATAKTSSTGLRKSSPSKPTTAGGVSRMSPSKTPLKSKTKEATKTPVPEKQPQPIKRPVPKTNGTAAEKVEEPQPQKLNGENGTHDGAGDMGEHNLLLEQQSSSLIDA